MSQTVQIIPIPAFKDNYIWLIHDDQSAIVVDPGDAKPVINTLQKRNLTLTDCLVTHHHSDHIGGIKDLQKRFPDMQVWASSHPSYDFAHTVVNEPEVLKLALNGKRLQFHVLDVPGHTLEHIAFYEPKQKWLFCGDTLFGAGCGRLFEGTPAQLLTALKKLADLPDETKVFCTHEYTEHNLSFALSMEPEHQALNQRMEHTQLLRTQGLPSLPSSIGLEKATNPFLRCHEPTLKSAINMPDRGELAIFTAIRESRNHF